MKIDGDSKKTNGWKSLKEMKEYLRSEFEKKACWHGRREKRICISYCDAYLEDVHAADENVDR